MSNILKIQMPGVEPIWAPFEGFSLIFNNPGKSFEKVLGNVDRIRCSFSADESLKLYSILWGWLVKADLEQLYTRFSLCPMSPSNYHVTAWDGLNRNTPFKARSPVRSEYESFVSSIPEKLSTDQTLFTEIMSSSLVTRRWNIGFRYEKFALWNNTVLVAVLMPDDSLSQARLELINKERLELTNIFDSKYGALRKNTTFVPHVTLGYFADPALPKAIVDELPYWEDEMRILQDRVRLVLKDIDLYAFSDMGHFYRILDTKKKTAAPSTTARCVNRGQVDKRFISPLIESLGTRYGISNKKPLRNFVFIGIQHIQMSLVPLIQAIMKCGIAPKDVCLIGKAYSVNPDALSVLEQLNCTIFSQTSMSCPDRSYEEEIEAQIELCLGETVRNLERTHSLSCLIVDEGGKAISLLHQKHPGFAHRFCCVEQTTRGINEIARLNLLCPVVNVARSRAKREIEGPLIARSMVTGLESRLNEWRSVFRLSKAHALIIGYGVIGRNLAQELSRRGFSVSVFERDHDSIDAVTDHVSTVETSLPQALSQCSVVVGCTGGKIRIQEEHLDAMRDHAILVNGASSDMEFESWRFRKADKIVYSSCEGSPVDRARRPWDNLYVINHRGKRMFLANGGFPINFSFTREPISCSRFQITRALMFLGILQCIGCSKGLHSIDEHQQDMLVKDYKSNRD